MFVKLVGYEGLGITTKKLIDFWKQFKWVETPNDMPGRKIKVN